MANLFSGLKVLDMATFIAGPGATTILSDFGADVIKIEVPGKGGCCHWTWWINRSPSAKTLQAGVFAMRQSGQATSAWSETHLTSSADPSLHHSMP
jgi:crotonobetainyl-CoA:carnitine CoA-transferase CaiB-like acyl-CoA transferase